MSLPSPCPIKTAARGGDHNRRSPSPADAAQKQTARLRVRRRDDPARLSRHRGEGRPIFRARLRRQSGNWRETFIQLWDVAENPERGFMPAGKFLAIMQKVAEHVPFDPAAKLTFEVSDGDAAIRLFKAAAVDISAEDGFVRVQLVVIRRAASRATVGSLRRTRTARVALQAVMRRRHAARPIRRLNRRGRRVPGARDAL